jgi:DNA-binding NtrC family response regulator
MTRILVAEDNATNRELFRELLEVRGFEVDEACDGPQALAMLEQALPDILLLDIGMPVLDGFAGPSHQAKPIVRWSACPRGHSICHAWRPRTHTQFWL